MEARKSVAISQQIENAFGVPHEASVSIRGGIIRGFSPKIRSGND